jgi:hypothetical protein
VRDEGKDQNAHHHDDEKEARSTSGMKITEVLYPIGYQHLTGLEGENRLVFGPVIFKDSSNLFEKRDGPKVSQKDHQSNDSIHQIEDDSACGNHGDGEPQPLRQKERDQEEEKDAEAEGECKGKTHGPGADLLLFLKGLIG